MGKQRLHTCDYSSSDSSEDWSTGQRQPELRIRMYTAANLAEGLNSRAYRLRALRELTALLRRWDSIHLSKEAQQAVIQDVFLAVQLQDGSQLIQAAQQQLGDAAKRVLPQQKQRQLTAALKRTGLDVQRSRRKAQARAQEDDSADDETVQVQLDDMPLEVLSVILRSLDLVSLAWVTGVCRSWHALAAADDVWLPWLQHLFNYQHSYDMQQQQPDQVSAMPASSSSSSRAVQRRGLQGCPLAPGSVQPGTAMSAFGRLAAVHPQAVLLWTSSRALVGRQLTWRQPQGLPALPRATLSGQGEPGSMQLRQLSRPGRRPLPLTVDQVVNWMLGQPLSPGSESSCSSSDSDEGVDGGPAAAADSGSTGGAQLAEAQQVMRLWDLRR